MKGRLRLLRLKFHLYYVVELTERKHIFGGKHSSVVAVDQEHTIAYIPREKGRPEVILVSRELVGQRNQKDTHRAASFCLPDHTSQFTPGRPPGRHLHPAAIYRLGLKPTCILAKKQVPSMPPQGAATNSRLDRP